MKRAVAELERNVTEPLVFFLNMHTGQDSYGAVSNRAEVTNHILMRVTLTEVVQLAINQLEHVGLHALDRSLSAVKFASERACRKPINHPART